MCESWKSYLGDELLERKILLHDPHGTKYSSITKPLLLQPIGRGLVTPLPACSTIHWYTGAIGLNKLLNIQLWRLHDWLGYNQDWPDLDNVVNFILRGRKQSFN